MNRTIPLILAVALFMENMDSTVIATSLPAIATDIGTSPIALKLALTSYLVSLAIFIPISGWMADRYGAKRVFRMAIGVFILGSIACAVSGSLLHFVLARFGQGLGGAMMTPVARLVLVRSTAKRDLVNAMAWLTVPALVGPLVGPPVGGFITTFFTWHWIFLINVPIGVVGIWCATRFLPDIEPLEPRPIDFAGFMLSAIAASGVVFGLSVVSLPALPPIVGLTTLAIGVVSGVAYVRHAWRAKNPILDPRVFGNLTFRAGITGGTIFRIGNGAVPFLLPLMFQLGFGLTPFQSGMLTFASAFGAIMMKFLAPTMLRLGGFRNVLIVAGLLAASFIGINGLFTPQTPHLLIILVLVGSGFLRSLYFTSTNALVFSEIDDKQASQATAISAVAQQISVALGVAIAGVILEAFIYVTGQPLGLAAFSTSFMIVAAITATGALPFLQLAPDAGSSVSGHGLAREIRNTSGSVSRSEAEGVGQ
ncbi:MFS transporter [Mesorhizobium sp. BAC0120]|uniref:MFS transporter n=1 Tax=Mesorhizobium sp. BAC0120 TaxID=3090670 RepID=UPI00298C7B05|nr:MFS transporter [Mesorhizobium sp. BAC0120]MDW6023152.1 MFS transporter [Mesorhizobium sp. BAC0120]